MNWAQAGLSEYLSARGNEQLRADCEAAAREHGNSRSSHTTRADDERIVDVTTTQGRKEYGKDALLKHKDRRIKQLEKRIVEQEDLVERIVGLAAEERPAVRFSPRRSAGAKERDALLPMFDMQFGSKVEIKSVPGGLNLFNEQIFTERAERYVEAVCGSLSDYGVSHTIKNTIILLGGDLVEGWGIFPGQEWSLEFDPVEQVTRLTPILEEMIDAILGHVFEHTDCENATIFGIPGNHGKIGKGEMPTTASWDYLILRWLQKTFARDKRIGNFAIESAGHLWFESMGHTFLSVHGDEVRGWGGIPYYGLTRFDAQAMRMHNHMFDYLLLGHHHRPANIEVGYGEHLMSGNWVGATQYAKKIVASGWPSQWVFYVSEEYGVSERSPIRLVKKDEVAAGPTIHALSMR